MTTAPLVPTAVQDQGAPTLEEQLRYAAPPAATVLRALLAAQARHQLFHPGQSALVAVSGGGDSVCLLHALHQLAPFWRITLHVAHLDHALRPDSAADAEFVATLAHELGLPFYQRKLAPGTLEDDPQGLEAAARLARYAFLRQIALQLTGGVTIATAHHQDDQAETLLLHLIQGSGLHGLAGMNWVGEVPDNAQPPIRLVRPLLGVSRAEIHAYLHSYGLIWREDSSNRDLTHLRNQVRHTILPQLAAINPKIHATLARTADLLAAEADHANRRDLASLDALTCEYMPSTRRVLDWFPLTQTDQATQRGVLRQAMLTLGIDLRTVGLEGIDNLLDQARPGTPSGPHPLIAGWSWTLLRPTSALPPPTGQNVSFRAPQGHPVCDEESHSALATQERKGIPPFGRNDSPVLSIHRTDALPICVAHPHFATPVAPPLPIPRQGALTHGAWQLHSTHLAPGNLPADWRSRNQSWRLFADADACDDLYLTTFQPGMTIAPLGMAGHQRAAGDIFTDRKVPPFLRGGWPVVVNGRGVVVWLCGLVVAEPVRVHAKTRQVRHLQWRLEKDSP